jgi:hypothetical protein
MIRDEDFQQELHEYLLSLKKNRLTAEALLEYMNRSQVLRRLGRQKDFSIRTMQDWLKIMEWRYREGQKGMYIDGHEREDVTDYRQKVFIPAIKEFEERMEFMEDGLDCRSIPDPITNRYIMVTYDESTFKQNDQVKYSYHHADQGPSLQQKGDGMSCMVSAFYMPLHGLLREEEETE